MNITVIDNYDSFVYNLVDYMQRSPGVKVSLYRNDKISVSAVFEKKPDAVVISPGPGRPEKAGICIELIKRNPLKVPLLGVCLGHQAIGAAFGANIKQAANIFHGKTSSVTHNGSGLFKSIKNPMTATRYHSLVIDKKTVPAEIEIEAFSEDGEIMAVKHKKRKIYGVQFHPESILTEEGLKMIRNFINMAAEK